MSCNAILKRGKRIGEECGNKSKYDNRTKCGRHKAKDTDTDSPKKRSNASKKSSEEHEYLECSCSYKDFPELDELQMIELLNIAEQILAHPTKDDNGDSDNNIVDFDLDSEDEVDLENYAKKMGVENEK